MVQMTAFLLACLACLSAPAIAADPIQACYDKARTQPELTHCSGLARQQADKELNAVYQAVLKKQGGHGVQRKIQGGTTGMAEVARCRNGGDLPR